MHPSAIGALLVRAPAVREFQVRQTERGADIAAVAGAGFDTAATAAAVTESLRRAGLPAPQVTVRRVETLDRDRLTGKARRFVPLRPPRAGTS